MSSMAWECTAADDGARLERLLRDKCRDLDPARRLSNRLIKEAIKQGEAFINGAVVKDKSRVLREGDTVELIGQQVVSDSGERAPLVEDDEVAPPRRGNRWWPRPATWTGHLAVVPKWDPAPALSRHHQAGAKRAFEDERLCRRPFRVKKLVVYLLITHSALEGGASLCVLADWLRCNLYPEHTDLRGDLILCLSVSAAGFLCLAFMKFYDYSRHWPAYLYALCCTLAVLFTVFAAHPTTISDEPFAGGMPVGQGNAGRAGRRVQESTTRGETEPPPPPPPCTRDTPIAWCVEAAEQQTSADIYSYTQHSNACTDVMKYAACGPGLRDDSCAESYPFDTFHRLAVRTALSIYIPCGCSQSLFALRDHPVCLFAHRKNCRTCLLPKTRAFRTRPARSAATTSRGALTG